MRKRGEKTKFKKIFKFKKGELLIGNIVFILLNLIFLSVLILFLLNQGSGEIVLEESYAKEIALLVDSAKAPMILKLDMEKGRKIAEDNGIGFSDVVNINGNSVNVALGEDKGYSYSFFNDVEVETYPDVNSEGMYVITISSK